MRRPRWKWRWKQLRITIQLVAVLAFCAYFLLLVYPLQNAWPPDLVFQLDPLSHLYLMLSGHGWPNLGWALLALGLLFALSRLFCGWLCPLGAGLDLVSGIRDRLKIVNTSARLHRATSPAAQRSILPANFDLYLLTTLLVLALFSNPLLWLFDPIVYSFKFLTVILLPIVDSPLRAAYNALDSRLYQQEWWYPVSDAYQWIFTSYHEPIYTDTTLFLLFTALIIGLELWQRRFWCRYICPLGALNRLTYRFHPLKRRIRPDCGYCLRCESGCHFGGTQEDDCLYCMECIDACATGKISFIPTASVARFTRATPITLRQTESDDADAPASSRTAYRDRLTGNLTSQRVSRRLVLEYAVTGVVVYPLLRMLDRRAELPEDFIRPPGVLGAASTPDQAESRFTELCLKCGQCLKACPTNGLQPALTEAGLSALWTPRLISRLGYCEYNCNLCGQVCPSGAIPRLSPVAKQSAVLGTAYFDRNRCIPFITQHNCTVCEEHCPTGDKAIKLHEAAPPYWPQPPSTGKTLASPAVTLQPYIDPALCIGCGICEKVCPLPGVAAVRVLRTPPGSAYSQENASGTDKTSSPTDAMYHLQ